MKEHFRRWLRKSRGISPLNLPHTKGETQLGYEKCTILVLPWEQREHHLSQSFQYLHDRAHTLQIPHQVFRLTQKRAFPSPFAKTHPGFYSKSSQCCGRGRESSHYWTNTHAMWTQPQSGGRTPPLLPLSALPKGAPRVLGDSSMRQANKQRLQTLQLDEENIVNVSHECPDCCTVYG